MNIEDKFFEELIFNIKKESNFNNHKLNVLKTNLAKKYKISRIIKNSEILSYTSIEDKKDIIKKLNIKPIRELSGVTVVALFAKPHSCPHGKCIYCPGGPDSVFGDTPQSYTGHEPAAQRAIRNLYDPYLQIFNRLEHYCVNGHIPDKLELIFMGGTFPSLNKNYKDEFVQFTYKAINDFAEKFIYVDEDNQKNINYDVFDSFFETKNDFKSNERFNRIHDKVLNLKNQNIKTYKEEILRNQTSLIRSIGLTIETKPDWALEKHCREMIEYSATRLEIGVQTLDENCLKKTNRGHTLQDTQNSFQIAKDMGLKINAHMMIGLPASSLEIDQESIQNLFLNEAYRPDMLKIYPCLVVEGTPLYKMFELGLFKPIETDKAAKIIANSFKYIPRYTRVMRIQRDIPTPQISAGVKNSNLRQYVDLEMKKNNIESNDIRAREIGLRQMLNVKLGTFKLKTEIFNASLGEEHFIDVADENDTMIGFIRLRFPYQTNLAPEITEKTALIRELHVYGQTIPVGGNRGDKFQHKGWGEKLLKEAEKQAKEKGYDKMIIISGVGVREYYKKFGYILEGPYMSKKL